MSFNELRHIKVSTKRRQCCWCGERIKIGESAVRIAGNMDGDFFQCFWHPECNDAFGAMSWKEKRDFAIDEPFEPGQFKRGSKEPR